MSDQKTPCFELRSHALETLFFVVKTTNLDRLRTALSRRFEAAPAFFTDDAVVIDVSALPMDQSVPVEAIASLLLQMRMRPIGVVAFEAQRHWVKLSSLPLVALPTPARTQQYKSDKTRNEESKPALIIDKPVRSGQQIYAKGDLIMLGAVNQGAEIMAEGHIHVYAPLRGRALAGISGNHTARIFCVCCTPELISIAGVYRTAETPLPDHLQGKPVQVGLLDEKLIIKPFNFT
jgi:septum site-determining protein MinC